MGELNNFSKKDDGTLYVNQIEDLETQKKEIIKELRDLHLKNISYLRNFYMQLLTISLLIIAIVLPVVSSNNQTIFKTSLLTYIGIVFISLNTIITIFYLTYIITYEYKRINRFGNFYKTSYDEAIKELGLHINDKKTFSEWQQTYFDLSKKNAEQEKLLGEQPKLVIYIEIMTWILSGLFVLGFILIGFSVLDFKIMSLVNFLNCA